MLITVPGLFIIPAAINDAAAEDTSSSDDDDAATPITRIIRPSLLNKSAVILNKNNTRTKRKGIVLFIFVIVAIIVYRFLVGIYRWYIVSVLILCSIPFVRCVSYSPTVHDASATTY